ncbi:unnamed protein product [Microthlaspi erraticum]|uniref:RRM domain-containing protein n=1 Tax=Microthlaspi erraticum TaxID=1685480 RepID=A0A6D2KCA7_9BRAS|nr:unnamed protein product [Microthlaspi erraticum]
MNGNASTSNVVPWEESVLNPDAPAFQPAHSDHSDDHSLFLTFSNGFPLSEDQVFNFFDSMYKGLVEKVYVHKPRAGVKPSLFGRIVFKRALIPNLVMGAKEKVSFSVEGRALCCRRFDSKKSKNAEPSVAPVADEDIGSTRRREAGSDGDDE